MKLHPQTVNAPEAKFSILSGPAAPTVITSPEQLAELYGWPLEDCRRIFDSSAPVTVVRIQKYGPGRAPHEGFALTDEQLELWRAGEKT